MSSPLPTIPDPGGTLESVTAAVRVIRQSLNILTANSLPGASGLSVGAQVFATTESVAGQTASIVNQIDKISASLSATWGVSINVAGYITGISLAGTATTSSFTIEADQFNLIMPGYAATPVMSVASVNGTPTLAFNGSIVADSTILNPGIANNAVSNSSGQNSVTSIASVSLTVQAGARVGVIAGYGGGNAAAAGGTMTLLVNGVSVATQAVSGANINGLAFVGGTWVLTVTGHVLFATTLITNYISAGGTDVIEISVVDSTSAPVAPTSILAFGLSK